VTKEGLSVGKHQRQLSKVELELARVKRELAKVKMERDILKKASMSRKGNCYDNAPMESI